MTPFSLPTAYLLVGTMYLVMPAVAWIVLSGLRSRSALWWCVGSAVFGVGVMFLGLRPQIATWASYPLANGLMCLGNLVRMQALRHELDRPWSVDRIVLLSVGFVTVYEYFRVVLEHEALRFFWSSSTLSVSFTYISWLCWRIGRQEASRSAYWVAGAYLIVAALMQGRNIAVGIGTSRPDAVLGGIDSLATVIVALMTSVVGSVGFIGIFLERSRRNDVAAAEDRAKQEENVRLGAQIAQLDRQRCLGLMSASLGHELNQPLTAILLDAQMGQHGLAHQRLDTGQLQTLLHDIETSTHRARHIIERIRHFIRPLQEHHKPVELGQLVCDVAQLVACEARNCTAEFVFVPLTAPVWVHGDAIQLSQIVLNVYCNAIQAMCDGSEQRQITVAVTQKDSTALLQINDSGPGLSPTALARVGQPFFSTKAAGLGLGLSISQEIAQRHQGTLHIRNGDQGGAQVELRLPAQS